MADGLRLLAPLLLVLSAPVTVALRGLPVAWARRLSRVLSTPYVRVVSHPVVAGLLNIGGLWLLYTTPLHAWMHASAVGHLLVHVHVLLAGWVFTAAILQVDPAPHPHGHPLRAGVLVAFLALLVMVLQPSDPRVAAEAAAPSGQSSTT